MSRGVSVRLEVPVCRGGRLPIVLTLGILVACALIGSLSALPLLRRERPPRAVQG
ncbi:MAG: hypothetical protein ACOY3Y_15360 [Acidobacteriota bacterium]